MSEKTELKNFEDIARFLHGLKSNRTLFSNLNNYLTQKMSQEDVKNFKKIDDLVSYFKRCVVDFIVNDDKVTLNKDEFKYDSSFKFQRNGTYGRIRFLHPSTVKAIINVCKANNLITDAKNIPEYMIELCTCTATSDAPKNNKIFPLDLFIYLVNSCYSVNNSFIDKSFVFIDMESFYWDNDLSEESICQFFLTIPLDCFNKFLGESKFVNKLGGFEKLKNLLEIEKLENGNDENAQALARKLRDECKKIDFSGAKTTNEADANEIKNENAEEETGIKIIDDEDYKAKVKRAFMIHQLPQSVASAIVFLFGVGLLFAAGFAWSVPFLLGIGFLISSGAAFANSILCMKPTQTRAWLAKIFKNCAWIIDGAFLITLGAVFCAGPLAIAFITFGSLSILMGCFNAFVGTLNSMWDTQRELGNPALVNREEKDGGVRPINDIKSEILSHKIFTLVGFAAACAAGILLALNPAILPIALPFLPAVGIGIAVLSGLGLIKSALRLFYDKNSWQVRCYHAAKYIKAGMFVLGGLALIALPFLPIAATLASVIGMPTLVINIFSFLVGLVSAVKGCMSVTRMSSNIESNLAGSAMSHAYTRAIPLIDDLTDELYDNQPLEPKLKPGDISNKTLQNTFYQ